MRVFVYEHLCATGAAPDSSLLTEGQAMLAAVLADFACLPGFRPVTLLAEDAGPVPQGTGVRRAATSDNEAVFRELAAAADVTLVIAPECGGILEARCRLVEEAGGRLLGPGPEAVHVTADKLLLSGQLRERGVPTPPCSLLPPGGTVTAAQPRVEFPAVCKPRHGAGSQATFLVRRPVDLPACLMCARSEGWPGAMILQPFVAGRPASAALLLGPRQQLALPPVWQNLSADGRFRYRGGALPLPPCLAARAQRLALRAGQAVTGLRGYVGVDLVLGQALDGSSDQVIEINPRLTTSYVGLRALAVTNLMEALLGVVNGDGVPELAWRPGSVEFQPDGHVRTTTTGYSASP